MKNTPDDRMGIVLQYIGKLRVGVFHPLKTHQFYPRKIPGGITKLEWRA